MRGEDDGSFVDLIQESHPVFSVQRFDALFFKRLNDVGIVYDHAQYVNRAGKVEIVGCTRCQDHGLDNTIAISAGEILMTSIYNPS